MLGLDRAELRRRRWEVPLLCLFFGRGGDVLPADVVLYAGGAGRAVREGQALHGEIADLFLVLPDEDVLIPHEVMQLLLVVLGELLLVLQLVLVHLLELARPAALLLHLRSQSIEAGPRVARAVLALALVDHVLILEHVPEGGYFQLGALELLVEVAFFGPAGLGGVAQLGQLGRHVPDLLLVAPRVQLVGIEVQRRFIALEHHYNRREAGRSRE